MQSVMKHDFSNVPSVNIPRSLLDRSHGYKTAFDASYLVPVFLDEGLPGDTLNLRMNAFARVATPQKPIMDNLFLDSFFFAVPYRLLWDNWEKFCGAQDNPADSTDYEVPQITGATVNVGDLSDYFGIPTGIVGIDFNSLAHRAYNLIWNEWFRDENLQDSLTVDLDDGPDTYGDYALVKRGKRHDYFTSCLPWPAKTADVTIPLGTEAPVLGIGKLNQVWATGPQAVYETGASATTNYANYQGIDPAGVNTTWYVEEDPNNSGYPNVKVDLANATAATINALREALQLQVLFENDARGGTRYIELVKSHFGVTSDDARMQRPEYIGGGSQPISVHPVQQTGETGTTPQGNLAAFATAAINGHGFTKSLTEHCLIIGMVNIRGDLTYQQGLPRMFSRRTREDHYWPALANLGEQEVLNKEIYMQGTAADDLVFGYQERNAEYKYKPSQITGVLRSQAPASLDVWTLAQEFTSLPTLGTDFIQDGVPLDRVIATPSEPHMIFDAYFDYKCARAMPVHSIPGGLGKL